MGYGTTPWGLSWGDPASGYYLKSAQVSLTVTAGEIAARPTLMPGCMAAVAMLSASSTTILNQLRFGAIGAASLINAASVANATLEEA